MAEPHAIDPDALAAMAPPHWGLNFTNTVYRDLDPKYSPEKVTLPDGYTVVVTGAGKGLGEYIARAYAQAKASNIIITARTTSDLDKVEKELKSIYSKVRVTKVTADASKPEGYQKIKQILESEYAGRLDCLVCNAGGGIMATGWGKLHDVDVDEFTQATSLNYLGPFYAAKYLIPLLLKGKGKTIINITSASSHLTSISPDSYNIAKLALNRLTQHIGEAYADEGLIAVAVHPGAVKTPGVDKLPDWLKGIAVDDIKLCGATCVWLSKEKRPYLSGRYVAALWELDELQERKDEIANSDKLLFRMVV